MKRKNERKNKLEDYLGMLSLSKGNIYDLVFVVLVACTLLKLRFHGTAQHSTSPDLSLCSVAESSAPLSL